MPDVLDANGLTVKTATEITNDLVAGLQGIYGADINTDQNGQDGQEIGILTQLCVDIRDLIVQVYNSFDPDQAEGTVLDQRVVTNNVKRAGGTYTIQPVDLVISGPCTLKGLDADFDNPLGTGYTVQDNNGNKFILIDTQAITTVGIYTFSFRAQQIGNVNVPLFSITNPVTVIPQVGTINNSLAATDIGENQETDPQLHLRRARSPALATTGYLNGLLAKVLQLPGVTGAQLYENVGNVTDANGIPAHGMWLVVAGGANTDIANLIYGSKSYGANMKGAEVVDITTPSGVIFPAAFDRPVTANLWLSFSIKTTTPGYDFDTDAIKSFLSTALVYNIGQFAETSSITDACVAAIAAQGGGGVPVLTAISSDGISYTDFLNTPTLNAEWAVAIAHISITVVP